MITKEYLIHRIAELQKQREEQIAMANANQGAILAFQEMINLLNAEEEETKNARNS